MITMCTTSSIRITRIVLRIAHFFPPSERVYAIRQRQERFVYARAVSQLIASRVCLVRAFASCEINQR
jgi:hypothetical protein